MIRTYGLILLAAAGVALTVLTVRASSRTVMDRADPTSLANPLNRPATPAASPFDHAIAGSGIVEASSDNVRVMPPIPGVVTRTDVVVGQTVYAGQPMLAIDDREAAAAVQTARAAVFAAEAEMEQLRAQPRPEDVPVAAAELAGTEADLSDAVRQRDRVAALYERGSAGVEERDRLRYAADAAEARRDASAARLTRIKAGAWAPDVTVAEARLAVARSELAAAEAHLTRHTLLSPIDGMVLAFRARVGERIGEAGADAAGDATILVGRVDPLHVRVDVDENVAWRLTPGGSAQVVARGDATRSAPATFVRIEPYVLPKRSLTGQSTERVDTRVLQVIYRFAPEQLPAYVGQQVDVFIDAPATAVRRPTTGERQG